MVWEHLEEIFRGTLEELRGITFIVKKKSGERVIIVQIFMDLLEAGDIIKWMEKYI